MFWKPGLATHPVMDESTSCTSGTVSVSVLSCRDSARSVLPLCGESRRKLVSTRSQRSLLCSALELGLHSPGAGCTCLPSVLVLVPVQSDRGTLLSQLSSPHKEVSVLGS